MKTNSEKYFVDFDIFYQVNAQQAYDMLKNNTELQRKLKKEIAAASGVAEEDIVIKLDNTMFGKNGVEYNVDALFGPEEAQLFDGLMKTQTYAAMVYLQFLDIAVRKAAMTEEYEELVDNTQHALVETLQNKTPVEAIKNTETILYFTGKPENYIDLEELKDEPAYALAKWLGVETAV